VPHCLAEKMFIKSSVSLDSSKMNTVGLLLYLEMPLAIVVNPFCLPTKTTSLQVLMNTILVSIESCLEADI